MKQPNLVFVLKRLERRRELPLLYALYQNLNVLALSVGDVVELLKRRSWPVLN